MATRVQAGHGASSCALELGASVLQILLAPVLRLSVVPKSKRGVAPGLVVHGVADQQSVRVLVTVVVF